MQRFIDSLNYSTCNEDSLTEIKALKITEADEILCITGSGGRVLNLLIENPKKIIAIDFNPVQNFLLELKIVSMMKLDYCQYIEFVGLKKCKNRLDIYDELKANLSQDCFNFWESNRRMIARGVLYQGKTEKYLKHFSNILKEVMGEKIDKLLIFTDLAKQRAYYESEWKDDYNWKRMISEYTSKVRETDPTYNLYVEKDYSFEGFLINFLDKGFKTHLIRENHFLCLIIDGSYDKVLKLPICLRMENYDEIKSNLHKVEIVTSDIVTYLKNTPPNMINKFSISDVGGYLSLEEYDELFKYLIVASRANGRLCARNIIANRKIPAKYQHIIIREKELELSLNNEDLSLEYEILVGQIIK